MYIPNDTDAVKNFYEVHLRKTKTFEDPTRVYQLMALANDIGGFTETVIVGDASPSQGDEVDTNNSVYECSGNAAACNIDLADIPAPAGGFSGDEVEDDILIFKATDVTTGNIVITDETPVITTLNTANDVVVYKYDFASSKWVYWCMAIDGDTANQEDYFTEVGILDEGPSIITEKGDSRMTSKGYELYAKKISFESNDLQVNEANSDFYRSVVATGNVDIMFYNPEDTDHSSFLLNFPLDSFLSIKGNSWNTIPFSGSREMDKANIGNFLKLFKDTTV